MLYKEIEKNLINYYSEVEYLKNYSVIDTEIIKNKTYMDKIYVSIDKLLLDIKEKDTSICFIINGGQLDSGLSIRHLIYNTNESIFDLTPKHLTVITEEVRTEIPLCYILSILEQSENKIYYMLKDFTNTNESEIEKNIADLNSDYEALCTKRKVRKICQLS